MYSKLTPKWTCDVVAGYDGTNKEGSLSNWNETKNTLMRPNGEAETCSQESVMILKDIRELLRARLSPRSLEASGKNEAGEIRAAWSDVIETIDRFCFWFFAAFLAFLFIGLITISVT